MAFKIEYFKYLNNENKSNKNYQGKSISPADNLPNRVLGKNDFFKLTISLLKNKELL
jgi:hypothetical protein